MCDDLARPDLKLRKTQLVNNRLLCRAEVEAKDRSQYSNQCGENVLRVGEASFDRFGVGIRRDDPYDQNQRYGDCYDSNEECDQTTGNRCLLELKKESS